MDETVPVDVNDSSFWDVSAKDALGFIQKTLPASLDAVYGKGNTADYAGRVAPVDTKTQPISGAPVKTSGIGATIHNNKTILIIGGVLVVGLALFVLRGK